MNAAIDKRELSLNARLLMIKGANFDGSDRFKGAQGRFGWSHMWRP